MENCKDVINAFSKCDSTNNILACTFDEDTKIHKCTFNDKECVMDDNEENKKTISNLNKVSENKDSNEVTKE